MPLSWQAGVPAALAAPWLAPYQGLLRRLVPLAGAEASVADALNALMSAQAPIHLARGPLRFVSQSALPAGEAYEAFIARTACVPTRDNLHDLFNGLVWLRFPALKRHLNLLQAAEIAACGVSGRRGGVRDALTLFDENAAFWQAPGILAEALQRRDWAALFGTERKAWAEARPTLFGHALMEKLMQPRKAITAHVWLLPGEVDAESFFVGSLTPGTLAAKAHWPLPVLGVPGWWPANESADFYRDDSVFRPVQIQAAAQPRLSSKWGSATLLDPGVGTWETFPGLSKCNSGREGRC